MTYELDADVLFSTRQWEFPVDEIRLSSITNSHFFRFIKSAFEFERLEMDHVPQVDGTVQHKFWPPGILCEFGVIPLDGNQPLAVRKLGIGATSILVEAGGTSDHTQTVYDTLEEMLDGIATLGGVPVLGTPRSHTDFSVIVFNAPSPAMPTIIQPEVLPQLSEAFSRDTRDFSPSVTFRCAQPSQTIDAAELMWELRPRFETRAADGRAESRARLHSDDHLKLLEQMFDMSAS